MTFEAEKVEQYCGLGQISLLQHPRNDSHSPGHPQVTAVAVAVTQNLVPLRPLFIKLFVGKGLGQRLHNLIGLPLVLPDIQRANNTKNYKSSKQNLHRSNINKTPDARQGFLR